MSMTKPNNATPNRSPKAILSKPVNTADEMAALLVDVSSNPAKIVWPRDAWGFTSPLKK